MINSDDITLKGEISALKVQLSENTSRSIRAEATVEHLNKSIAAGNRLSNWQFIGFVVVMAGTLLGTMYWAANMLERRIEQTEKRIELMERNFDAQLKQIETNNKNRFDDTNRRIDDLKQVILSKR